MARAPKKYSRRKHKPVRIPEHMQQDLFQVNNDSDQAANPYTHIIEYWSLLPRFNPSTSDTRYHYGLSGKDRIWKNVYEYKNNKVLVEVHAVTIELSNSVRKKLQKQKAKKLSVNINMIDMDDIPTHAEVFPGVREEKVEDALIYLATRGVGVFEDEKVSVHFTLYGLQKVLKATGKTMSLDEIKESLDVLRGARCKIINLKSDLNDPTIIDDVDSNLISDKTTTNRVEYLEKIRAGENALCSITFHSFVRKAIAKNEFRLANHDRRMRINNPLARAINKELEVHFKNAQLGITYKIWLKKTFQNCGKELRTPYSENRKAMVTALQELIKLGVILEWEEQKVMDAMDGRVVQDSLFILHPTAEFSRDMIVSHLERNKTVKKIESAHNIVA